MRKNVIRWDSNRGVTPFEPYAYPLHQNVTGISLFALDLSLVHYVGMCKVVLCRGVCKKGECYMLCVSEVNVGKLYTCHCNG